MTDYDFTELRRRFGDIDNVEPVELDHAAEAERLLNEGSGRAEESAIAQVHATLAVRDQLRRIADALS